MTIKELEKHVAALLARHPAPPTFEQFKESWSNMDTLSKSLYEAALNCPQLADVRHWDTIRGYLLRMGIEPGEDFDLEKMGKELVSDNP